MTVTDYAAKFVELAKFYPNYNGENAEFSKCIKFENGLRSKIKKAVGYRKIRVFSELVDSFKIYEIDNTAHYKVVSEKRKKNQQNRAKPYDTNEGKLKVAEGKKTSGGGAPAGVTCFKCGKAAHKSFACDAEVKRCFRCGKTGHEISECKRKDMVCFNYGEEAHIGSQFQKPKKTQSDGKVFALMGSQTDWQDGHIGGNVSLVVLL
ncbi:uncharacterized protein LOC131597940 [Vicia villosa]|uniref:uncharacterized protein LOC131597940 n=1 Tax=Vicia villosa TaxID=3911 RepID=UPI00273AD083|nr:uncharacterized protein LOC131597940 [Vicia villosa]